MGDTLHPQPGIMDIELYVGGKAPATGVSNTVKLSSNENPLGPSPAAKAAFREVADQLHLYPSSNHADLRAAIAEVHDLDPDRIICGSGSDEVITFLCQAYAGEGNEVLFTEHGFAMYRIGAQAVGATPVEVAEVDRTTDVDALLAAVTPASRLVLLANQNNPTGTMISPEEVIRLAEGIPPTALLVLDGAYAEYIEGFDGHLGLTDQFENVFVTRTFSKIYGLGSLRVGWGYGSRDVIDVLNRIRGPFNVNAGALAAAEAAMRDQDYVDHCRAENAKSRAVLIAGLRDLGLGCDDSHANFVLPRFADADQAARANTALEQAGLLVRPVGSYNLPDCLRITVGHSDDCRRILSVLQGFLRTEEAA